MNKINKVRDGKYLQDAVDWFRYNHINLYSVNYNPEPVSSSPKLYCDYYIEGLPHVDIEFYKQKIINFVKWI